MKKFHIALIILFILPCFLKAQDIIELYQGTIPNSIGENPKGVDYEGNPGLIRKVYKPSLEIYLPDKENASGAAVIICPGGGYSVIVFQGEGVSTAKEFAKKGIAAFVLKYRLPNDSIQSDKSIAPLQDAQQAIKVVRENAGKWNIDTNKIGIMGFSAGGHLAASEATHFKKPLIDNKNNTSLRPDFQILVYPVISMQNNLTHADSKKKLLGENPSKEIVDLYSNELQVTEDTPPAYLTHSADDKVVDIDNTIAYFEQLRKNNVRVEMHIFPEGGHGFIFRYKPWIDPLFQWMYDMKLIKTK